MTSRTVPFAHRLAEAIAWCEPLVRADPRGERLRNPGLRPPLLVANRAAAVDAVVGARARFVGPRHGVPLPTLGDLRGGRLLGYLPEDDLADGAAEQESNGYFDAHNTPPWDTWVALAESPRGPLLVSWVPPELIRRASDAVDANPEQCVLWLAESEWLARGRKRRSPGP